MDATLIRVGLWIHIAAAAGVFIGVGAELLSGHLLVRAKDTSEVRALDTLAEYGGRVAALSLVGLLLSGPDLASRTGIFEGAGVRGWIAVAIVVILVIGGLGGALHRKAFVGARKLAGEGARPVDDALRAHLAKPAPWISMHVVLGMVLGTLWIMSNQPSGVIEAITPVALGLLVGAAMGLVVARLTAGRLTA